MALWSQEFWQRFVWRLDSCILQDLRALFAMPHCSRMQDLARISSESDWESIYESVLSSPLWSQAREKLRETLPNAGLTLTSLASAMEWIRNCRNRNRNKSIYCIYIHIIYYIILYYIILYYIILYYIILYYIILYYIILYYIILYYIILYYIHEYTVYLYTNLTRPSESCVSRQLWAPNAEGNDEILMTGDISWACSVRWWPFTSVF